MSASVSLLLFWGGVIATVLALRQRPAGLAPDKYFTDTYKGLAMFLVLYHHSRIYHAGEFWFLFLGGDAYAGVSLFFFISGFGLTRSQEKYDYSLPGFILVRFLALAPGVALCMLLRGWLGPLWGQQAILETDPLTLLGLREWFLIALWTYYLSFILSWTFGRSLTERCFYILAASLITALVLIHIQGWWPDARLWWRFPFSFALGVLVSRHMEGLLQLMRRRAWPVLALTGLILGLAWTGKDLADLPMNWAADLAVIPFSLALCSLLYRFGLTSRAWIFLGRNSLALYLLQVPLLKQGWLLGHWRGDILGLLTTWAVIFALAGGAGWAQRRLARVISALSPRPGQALAEGHVSPGPGA